MEYTFLQIPKRLFSEDYSTLSPVAKLLYGFLLERHQMSLRNNWHDKSGDTYIYFPTQALSEALNISLSSVLRLLKELEENNLITRLRQGRGKPDRIFITDLLHQKPIKKPNKKVNTEPKRKNNKYGDMITYDIKEIEAIFNSPLEIED